jgi:hypothetical protein
VEALEEEGKVDKAKVCLDGYACFALNSGANALVICRTKVDSSSSAMSEAVLLIAFEIVV